MKKSVFKKAAKVISAALMAFSSTATITPVFAEENNYQLVKGSVVAKLDGSNFVHTAGAWEGYPTFDLWVREIMVQNTSNLEDTRAAWCTQPGIPTFVSDIYHATKDHPGTPVEYGAKTPDYEGAKKVVAAYYANHFSDSSKTKDLDNALVGTMEGYSAVQLAVWTKVLGGNIDAINVDAEYEDVKALAKTLLEEAESINFEKGTDLVSMTPGTLEATVIEDNATLDVSDMKLYTLSGREGYYYGTDLISVNPKQDFLTFDRNYNVSLENAPEGTIIAANELSGEHSAILAEADSSGSTDKVNFGFNTDNGTTFRIFIPAGSLAEGADMKVNITDGTFYRTDMQFWVTDTSNQAFISPTTNPENFAYSFNIHADATQIEDEPVYYPLATFTITKLGEMPRNATLEDDINVLSWDKYNLNDATFSVYYAETFTDSYGIEHKEGEVIYENATTTGLGKVTIANIPVKAASKETPVVETMVKVVETSSPDGYQLNATEYEAALVSMYVTEDLLNYEMGFTEADVGKVVGRITEGVREGEKLHEEDTLASFIPNTPIKLNTLSFTKNDNEGNPLAGAVFGLYTTKDIIFPEVTEGGTLPAGSLVAKMTSDTDGTVALDSSKYQLPTGMNYTLKEISAPEGYVLDTGEYTVVPDESGVGHIYLNGDYALSNDEYINSEEGQNDENAETTASTLIDELTALENEPFRGKIKVIKTDDNSTPLEGVEFELRDADDEVLETKKTDANGEINFETEIAYGETVTVVETEPLEGYAKLDPVEVTMDDMSESLVTLPLTNSKLPYFAEIRKIDTLTKEPIQGAEFSLYEEGNDTALETKATDEDGVATFTTALDQSKKYYALETGTPDGYLENAKRYDIKPINITAENNTVPITAENQKEASVKIVKTDADSEEPLAGVEFSIYDEEDTEFANPLDTQTTDDKGEAVFAGLDYNKKYVVKETKALDEYLPAEASWKVEFTDTDLEAETIQKVLEIDNTLRSFSIVIHKTDAGYADVNLEGAEFTLYDAEDAECENALQTATTDSEGKAEFTNVAVNRNYVVIETKAPEGYLVTDPVEIEVTDVNQTVYEYNLTDERIPYQVEVVKKDDYSSEPLEGIEFTLYEIQEEARNNMVEVETVATNEEGVATFETELSQYKTYVVKETKGLEGYLPNETVYSVNKSGELITSGKVTIEVTNQKEAIVEVEKRSSSEYNNIPLAGAEFTIYESTDEIRENPVDVQVTDDEGKAAFSGLDYKKDYVLVETKAPVGYSAAEDVAIDFSDEEIAAEKVVHSVSIQDNPLEFEIRITKHDLKDEGVLLEGAEFTLYAADDTEFKNPLATATTDENGYAVFTGVRNDRNYIVVETKAPDNYLVATPVAVNVEDVNKSVYEYSVADEKVPYWVQVLKIDDKTEKALEGAEFGLYINGNDEPIETATTDINGIAVFKTKLSQYESYYIQEIKAPEHYELNKNRFDIAYNTGTAVDNEEGNIVRQYTVGNARMLYTAEITKNDIRDGFGTLQGAEFTLYRADDENLENPVATAVSDQNGIARFTGLDITESFIAVETKAPEGYLLSNERIEITPPDVSKDTTTEHYSRYTFDNQRKAEIAVIKMSSSPYDNRPLADAEFTLYDAEDMNTALDVKTTGADGKVTFENLDYNKTYVVAETKAPLGYKAAENQTIKFSENEIMSATIVHNVTFNDDVLEFPVEIIKQDSEDNSRKLKGAEFTIYAADDTDYKNPLETVTTDENGRAVFEKVAVDRNYVVRETRPPYGYRDSTEIIKVNMNDMYYDSDNPASFKVEPYTFENDPMKVTIEVIKESNDISDDPETTENESRLYGAQFQLFRASDTDFENPIAVTATEESGVYMADESSENHTIITNANGTASVGNLRREEYVLKETGAPGGHELNLQNFRVDASTAADNSTVSITVTDNMIPGIRTANVLFTKRDDSGRFLPGAELQVLDASTEEVLSTWTSSVDSEIFEIRAMLPGTYILRETKAPFGYMLAGDIEFTVRDNGTIDCDAIEEGVIVMVDESSENPGTRISKQNVDGEKIQGARLTILDEEGKPVYTWTSEPERTREIPLDPGKYTLHEVLPPEGYQVAEDIAFEVTETGEVISDALKDGEIVMIDYRDGENPRTGLEGKNIWKGVGFVAIGVALIAGVTIVAVKNKKKEDGTGSDTKSE